MTHRQKRPIESIDGLYAAIPNIVLDSAAFIGASYTAKALLFDVMRQHSGKNNGHLQLSFPWLKKRGWDSRSVVQRARGDLINRQLIILTRTGGLNMGPSRYAVTWLPISNFLGLDIQSKNYHKGAYTYMDKLPLPEIARAIPIGGTGSTCYRASTVPFTGPVEVATVP